MPDGRSNSGKFILALDDELDIVTLIKEGLRKSGFRVSVFTNPVMALEDFKINAKDYSVVISDIRMPDMNGYEFAKRVKTINTEVRVIFMTAFEFDDNEFHRLLPSIKIDAFLQKPFSIKQLKDTVGQQFYRSNEQ
jgi:DNA-binding response OmpR family regulator